MPRPALPPTPPVPAAPPARASRSERGAITPWVMGLTVLLLFTALAVVDLAGAVSDRRVLSAMADAAAAAGSSGIDESQTRTSGGQALDLPLARRRAEASIAAQPAADRALLTAPAEVGVIDGQVVVRLRGRGRIGVLGAVAGDVPLEVTAVSRPRRRG